MELQTEQQGDKSNVILGMIMLNDVNSWDANALVADFAEHYYTEIGKIEANGEPLVFKVNDETVALMFLPVPIPNGDIEGTAKYAYNWPDAMQDISAHKSHIIISLLSGGNNQIKRFRIFTQVICSLLRITNAVGVY